jgi:hypothetical protein
MKCPHCGEEIESIHSKGGHARAVTLTKAQRSDIARKAAAKRWENHKKTAKKKR